MAGRPQRPQLPVGLPLLRPREAGRAPPNTSGPTTTASSPTPSWPASCASSRARRGSTSPGCEAAGFDEGISAPNRLFTASSRANEKSYELPDSRQSVFTLLLVEQGLVQGRGRCQPGRQVSVQEAFAYAADRAPQITAGQSQGAQHPVMKGWDGTPLFLDAVAAAARARQAQVLHPVLVLLSGP